MDPDSIISPEIARTLCGLSTDIGRQIGILVDRAGRIALVIVGDQRQIVIPSLTGVRTGGIRLKGLRCIHTHLATDTITDDDLMDLLFLRLDLMAVLNIGKDGQPGRVHAAHLVPTPVDGSNWAFLKPQHLGQLPTNFQAMISALEEEFARLRPVKDVDQGRDRAILVGVTTSDRSGSRQTAEESMAELEELAISDDVLVLDTVIQKRQRINPKWILGKGKLAEIMLNALRLNANLLIFNRELNPSQIRSITDHTDLRVIDRTQLILDIFARRALSREGKLQIEMAQLKYMLPRLSMRDDALSRLTGGIGGRGPGETRLEIDRRRINDRLTNLANKLQAVSRERHQRRSRRRKKQIPIISLVGYTNAGKSTLLNTLTKSNIVAEDKLFATLDPTSRRLRFPRDVEVLITDTVGFIRNLPSELIQAFKATLEELNEADILVHIIDISNSRFHDHIQVVDGMLQELKLNDIPCLRVFNKTDLVDQSFVETVCRDYNAIPLSALDRETFMPFLEKAQSMIYMNTRSQVSGIGSQGKNKE